MSKPDTRRFYRSSCDLLARPNYYRQEMARLDAQRARTVTQLLVELKRAREVLHLALSRRTAARAAEAERLRAVSR